MFNFFEILIVVIAFFFLGAIFGASQGKKIFQDEAVKKGKAQYFFDDKNGNQWRWKE